jgi:hypothetical protein
MDGRLRGRVQFVEGHLRAVRTSVVCGDGFEGAVVTILAESEPTNSWIYRN